MHSVYSDVNTRIDRRVNSADELLTGRR